MTNILPWWLEVLSTSCSSVLKCKLSLFRTCKNWLPPVDCPELEHNKWGPCSSRGPLCCTLRTSGWESCLWRPSRKKRWMLSGKCYLDYQSGISSTRLESKRGKRGWFLGTAAFKRGWHPRCTAETQNLLCPSARKMQKSWGALHLFCVWSSGKLFQPWSFSGEALQVSCQILCLPSILAEVLGCIRLA